MSEHIIKIYFDETLTSAQIKMSEKLSELLESATPEDPIALDVGNERIDVSIIVKDTKGIKYEK